ncbi:ESX secretion-associated protein EspG [Nocardia blacklockiae]|uniref:ESX secretion-associated protein EspG n=1 Tax=Nocardia blacklockiae TaxID=480036 RepID=UPI00189468F3|nr:ESX secretion-associated protein EspG [Nocardia blacklockiae]MBF6172612.1 ESX secretion-associated protein EspG [Nocardia blacklockiae]
MAEWDWDPDDFAVLWYGEGHDRFPRPLAYTSRFPTNDEVDAHRVAVRNRYDADETERIHLAFHTLAHSELRIEILGESMTLGRGKPREYRVVGARTPYDAVMLTQTATPDTHGRIRCRLFPTEQLAPRLAHILPAFRAGNAAPETFHLDDVRDPTATRDHGHHSPGARLTRFLDRPIDGGGVAGLRTGPIHHRPEPWHVAQWLDFPEDGRYLQQRTREHLTVRPAATPDLTTLFTSWIDNALHRLHNPEAVRW